MNQMMLRIKYRKMARLIGEDVDEVEEGERERDGVEEPATCTRKRKTQTEKAPAKKTQTDKPPAKKAPTRKKPRNMPKPLTPIKKPLSKKRDDDHDDTDDGADIAIRSNGRREKQRS